MEASPDSGRTRPTLLPLLTVALAMWAGTALSYLFSFGLAPEEIGLALLLGLVPLIGGAAVCFKAKAALAQQASLCILGIGLGLACGFSAGMGAKARTETTVQGRAGDYRFEVVEEARTSGFSTTCVARTALPDGQAIRVRLVFKDSDPDVGFGDIIEARGLLRPPGAPAAEFFWQQGIDAQANVSSFEKRPRHDLFGQVIALRIRALEAIGGYEGQGAALLAAVLVGERKGLDDAQGLYGDIRVVGLAHLVAVSGSHLVIVGAFLASALRFARVRRSVALAVQLVFILAYLVFTGMQVSAVRAAYMSVIVLFSFFARRRASSMNALALCIILVLGVAPTTSVSVSFLLSAASTLSIIVVGGLFDDWCRALVPSMPALVRDGLSLTLASNIVVVPLAAAFFSQVSLISPLANVVAAPVFAFLCAGGLAALCAAMAFPALAAFLLAPFLMASQGFCELVSLMAKVPYAAIPANAEAPASVLVSLLLFSALWLAWPRPSRRRALALAAGSALVAVCMVFILPLWGDDEIIMLDVGQGDAFVVKSRGSSILIDTGTHDGQLLSGLSRHGVYRLETIVITHPDDDHCGSLMALRGIVAVGGVCVARPLLECGCGSCERLVGEAESLVGAGNITPLQVGDRIQVENLVLEAVWPQAFKDKGGNADSLGLLLERQGPPGWKALFTGDLESKQVNALLSEGRVGDIDILKVGHHGSRAALDPESVAGLRPEIALISVGKDNRYGHPSPEALGLLGEAGCAVFRSDEEGDVVCKLTDTRVSVMPLG